MKTIAILVISLMLTGNAIAAQRCVDTTAKQEKGLALIAQQRGETKAQAFTNFVNEELDHAYQTEVNRRKARVTEAQLDSLGIE